MGGYQKSVFDCLHTNNHKQALIWLDVPPNNNPQLIFCSAGHRETPGIVYESTHLKLLITECIVTCYVNAQPTTTIYNPLRAFRTREKSHNMLFIFVRKHMLCLQRVREYLETVFILDLSCLLHGLGKLIHPFTSVLFNFLAITCKFLSHLQYTKSWGGVWERG